MVTEFCPLSREETLLQAFREQLPRSQRFLERKLGVKMGTIGAFSMNKYPLEKDIEERAAFGKEKCSSAVLRTLEAAERAKLLERLTTAFMQHAAPYALTRIEGIYINTTRSLERGFVPQATFHEATHIALLRTTAHTSFYPFNHRLNQACGKAMPEGITELITQMACNDLQIPYFGLWYKSEKDAVETMLKSRGIPREYRAIARYVREICAEKKPANEAVL